MAGMRLTQLKRKQVLRKAEGTQGATAGQHGKKERKKIGSEPTVVALTGQNFSGVARAAEQIAELPGSTRRSLCQGGNQEKHLGCVLFSARGGSARVGPGARWRSVRWSCRRDLLGVAGAVLRCLLRITLYFVKWQAGSD